MKYSREHLLTLIAEIEKSIEESQNHEPEIEEYEIEDDLNIKDDHRKLHSLEELYSNPGATDEYFTILEDNQWDNLKRNLRERPWLTEPNYLLFKDKKTGLSCEVIRHREFSSLCGYVLLPINDYAFIGSILNELEELGEYEVHWGITFAEMISTSDGDFYKIGFDCAHAGDFVPYDYMLSLKFEPSYNRHRAANDVYRDINYVMQECSKLASQFYDKKLSNEGKV